jgi:PAS domain S-box-containing protein
MSDDAGQRALEAEVRELRAANAALEQSVADLQAKLAEPEEIIRAIREGEIEALVVAEQGRDEIFAIQRYDSVYRQLVEETLPYGVWLAEADGKLIYVSRQFLEWIGTDLRELQDKGQFHFLPEDFRRTFREHWVACRASGAPCTFEYPTVSRDGVERVIFTHGIRTTFHNGKVCWAGINLDVTEQRQVEAELRRKAAALEESDRRKDEFLALLGHELRNPLAVIQHGMHLLPSAGLDDAQRRQIADAVSNQVGHLTTLVNDLLDVARINRGTISLRLAPVDLNSAVYNALDAVRAQMTEKRHELRLALPESCVHVMADSTRLEQILSNLLHNAVKYTPEGGTLHVSTTIEDAQVAVRVRDSGIGISADVLGHIFDLFVQSNHALDRSQGGLGIGLTIVRKLVDLHGGTIEAHSDGIGHGSEFVVRFPIADVTDAEAPVRNDENAYGLASPHRLHVVVAEDSKDLASFLKLAIGSWGYDVEVVHDGESALAAALAKRPDAMLLDIGLPATNGYEVARRVRDRFPPGSTPTLIAMTGYGQERDRQLAAEAGFDQFLVKPADPQHLRDILSDVERKQQQSPTTGADRA